MICLVNSVNERDFVICADADADADTDVDMGILLDVLAVKQQECHVQCLMRNQARKR